MTIIRIRIDRRHRPPERSHNRIRSVIRLNSTEFLRHQRHIMFTHRYYACLLHIVTPSCGSSHRLLPKGCCDAHLVYSRMGDVSQPPKQKVRARRVILLVLLATPIALYSFLCFNLQSGIRLPLIGPNTVMLAPSSAFSYRTAYNVYTMPGDVPSNFACPYYIPALDGHNIQIGRLVFFVADTHRPGRWVVGKC